MAITYSISGGADSGKFNIDGASGKLTFKTAPDFENAGDANRDNVYEVQVKATDAGGAATTQDLRVTVKDVSENLPPQITSSAAVSVNENQTTVVTVTATDPDAGGSQPPGGGTEPSSGFPDETNTGVPAGTTLTNSGSITVTADGTVISGKRITGMIIVRANNVVVENCDINGSGNGGGGACVDQDAAYATRNLTVRYCKLYAVSNGVRDQSSCGFGVRSWGDRGQSGLEVHHCNIYGMENGIANGAGYVHDNFIHDFQQWDGGPDKESHCDCIQTFTFAGASGQRVIHNTFWGYASSGDMAPWPTSSCYAGSSQMSNVTIENNLIAGGGWSIYGTQDGTGSGWKVINNHFSTKFYPKGGYYGIATGLSNEQWSGNVWHETGQPA